MIAIKLIGKAPAKINLAIDVISKRSDGYHNVSLIMQSIALFDIISLETINEDKIIVNTNSHSLPDGPKNIAYKAAKLIKDKYNIKEGARIYIEKNIPMAAGLGGGSTDAACTLKLLNKAWDLKLDIAELMNLGAQIGADIAFCIAGGTALAEGIGEKITLLKPLPKCYILLIKPNINISTKEIYSQLDLKKINKRPNMKNIIRAIEKEDLEAVSKESFNVLESITIKKCPIIATIKEELMRLGALGSLMTGSGPTVYGIFNEEEKAYYAYEAIKNIEGQKFLVESINNFS